MLTPTRAGCGSDRGPRRDDGPDAGAIPENDVRLVAALSDGNQATEAAIPAFLA